MSDKTFSGKYNFDLSEEIKNSKINSFDSNKDGAIDEKIHGGELKKITVHPENKHNKEDKEEDKSFHIKLEKITNERDIKIINNEKKTYEDVLKRKIYLNFNMLKIFVDNFYRDEFNNTRKSSYFLILSPATAFMFFYYFSPYSPFLGGVVFVSFTGSMISFFYQLNKEINHLSKIETSSIGRQIRMIKNELGLYNPLVVPVYESQVIKDNNKI